MRMRMRYVNAEGREFDFSRPGVSARPEELRDWSLDHTLMNGAVASHSLAEREVEVPVAFWGDPRAAMDELRDVCRADVLADRPGRLYLGDWYTECYLEGSAPRYWNCGRDCDQERTLTFYSADPSWLCERSWAMPSPPPRGGMDYPHGFAFDYMLASPPVRVECRSLEPCDVRVEVMGPASSPRVSIGPNSYGASVEVPEGCVLRIDTRAKEAVLADAGGRASDVLGETPDAPPGSGEYAFEKVPPGAHLVTRNGSFPASVTVYEKEVEPPWS